MEWLAMALAPGEARKDLSADALFRSFRSRFASLPDPRSGEVEIPLADALMSAFAMFSLKDHPCWLSKRRDDPDDNFRTIYGINRVPCDSQMRAILDPVDPALLRPMFCDVFRCLQRGKVLKSFVYLDGHYLISLDGTRISPPPRSIAPPARRSTIATAPSLIPTKCWGPPWSIPITRK